MKILRLPKQACTSALCWLALLSGVQAQKSWPPPPEPAGDKTLAACIRQLKKAVETKDTAALYALVARDIRTSFGDDNGLAAFKTQWELPAKGKDSELWTEMNRVLSLGGDYLREGKKQNRNTFVFPYLYNIETDDPFTHCFVTGSRVNLREKPDLQARVLAQLTYEVVEMAENDAAAPQNSPADYQLVKARDGKLKGWIASKYLYSPAGYRLFLERTKKGKWQIGIFVAGD